MRSVRRTRHCTVGYNVAMDTQTYTTKQIAQLAGVHPNTVRFYEAQGLLPAVPRRPNGYRVYAGQHVRALQLIRLAFSAEIISDNLRQEAIAIVKASAAGDDAQAIALAEAYRSHLHAEMARAREAMAIVVRMQGEDAPLEALPLSLPGRREAASRIGISMDVLRDWERNGLIEVPRKGNRRYYGPAQMDRLKIIAILRGAHYSQMAIRRMLHRLDLGVANWPDAIDTPDTAEDIVSVADRYLTSLHGALSDAGSMLDLLRKM